MFHSSRIAFLSRLRSAKPGLLSTNGIQIIPVQMEIEYGLSEPNLHNNSKQTHNTKHTIAKRFGHPHTCVVRRQNRKKCKTNENKSKLTLGCLLRALSFRSSARSYLVSSRWLSWVHVILSHQLVPLLIILPPSFHNQCKQF